MNTLITLFTPLYIKSLHVTQIILLTMLKHFTNMFSSCPYAGYEISTKIIQQGSGVS